jgi:hypothetical protein
MPIIKTFAIISEWFDYYGAILYSFLKGIDSDF